MTKRFRSASDAAAFLAEDKEVGERVEREVRKTLLIQSLLHMRVEKRLTQKEIADRMGCDPSKISKMEGGNDLALRWGDVLGYLEALGVGVSMMFEDASLPAADRIKQHVFRIHDLLEELAGLANQVCDDPKITERIHQFYGEVLFNFVRRFTDSFQKLPTVIRIPQSDREAVPRETIEVEAVRR
jgi:transcriptional regulator with XRE-family HTH domain